MKKSNFAGLNFKGMSISFKDSITVILTLFAVIDILGSIPVIFSLRKKQGSIHPGKATLFAGALMIVFLFVGKHMLSFIGIDIASFAIAGSIVIFIIGLEMVLGQNFFKPDPESSDISIVPLAFPLIAGAGSLTTILSLRVQFGAPELVVGILVNLAIVYFVLRSIPWMENKIGSNTLNILRRIFGVLLLAIAVKIFQTNVLGFIQG
jgi:multiple antibiotic resistance protein